MRIAILGGTFNPPHYGHLALGDFVVEHGYADEVWYMVSPHNPLKETAGCLPETERLQLVEKLIAEHRGLRACSFEFDLPRPSYTINTLTALRASYPQHDFVLLIGADNWVCFHEWHEWQRILDEYEILIYPREGCRVGTDNLPSGVQLLDARLHDISSTMLRNMKVEVEK